MRRPELLVLNRNQVIAAGGDDMGAAIADVQHGFELRSAGRVVYPHKTVFRHEGRSDTGFNILPASLDLGDRQIFGCKILAQNPENPGRGLPQASGLIMLYDGETGMPFSVMDAEVISAVRTGAVSGLAARHLVDSGTDSVGLVGAGVNMRTQLRGVHHERPGLQKVTVFSRGETKRAFADEMSAQTGLAISPAESVRSVVEDNTFIITCTTRTTEPLFETASLASEGLTVFNISGVATPPDALATMDRLITDSWADCQDRGSQTLPIAVEQGYVDASQVEELSTILQTGEGRRNPRENVFFCPVGAGMHDTLVAWRVYNNALAQGV